MYNIHAKYMIIRVHQLYKEITQARDKEIRTVCS